MKSFFLIITVLLCVYSCNRAKSDGDGSVSVNNGVFTVSLNKIKSDVKIIPLSSLVESLELVQLECHEDAFFRSFEMTTVYERYIGVRPTLHDNFKLFDRSGNFLTTVGRRGPGPGEYTNSIGYAIIDEKNELIYLAVHPNKILVYNTSGQFVKEFFTPQMMFSPRMFLSDDILTVAHIPTVFLVGRQNHPEMNNSGSIMFQFDVNTGELLKELATPAEHFVLRGSGFGGGVVHSNQNIPGLFDFMPRLFTQEQYDTLYHIDLKNNKFLPIFTLDYNFTTPQDKPSFIQLNKNLIMTQTVKIHGTPTPHGTFSVERCLIATDLTTKTSSRVKIINDFFGGLDALPDNFLPNHFRRGYYVRSIQPEDLMEDIKDRLADRNISENDRQILNRTLSTLREGTNNVVFIGKLKNEIKLNLN